jgi:hypothetical protein
VGKGAAGGVAGGHRAKCQWVRGVRVGGHRAKVAKAGALVAVAIV